MVFIFPLEIRKTLYMCPLPNSALDLSLGDFPVFKWKLYFFFI